jgi:hypothetical protein
MLRAGTIDAGAGEFPGFFAPGESAAGLVADRLVKGTKCPTRQKDRIFDVIGEGGEWVQQIVNRYRVADVQADGTRARLSFREWSGEWRLRCEADIPPSSPPPDNTGDRITHRLSDRGARALGESCEFVTIKQGGYSTFLTLTLDAAARKRIETRKAEKGKPGKPGEFMNGIEAWGDWSRVVWGWESSIQREASRFFDAAVKMYKRGWVPEYHRGRVVTEGDGTQYTPINWNTTGERMGPDGPFCLIDKRRPLDVKLSYLWVAENPTNEAGERNPHIHVLLRWRVPFAVFPCWARRLEKLWGQGFAHLEKLKNAEASGYYIAKAAGYLTKAAGESDQGPIRGNRYGIAQCARAPGWEPVLVWAWGVLGHLIEDAREKWKATTAPLRAARDAIASKLKETPKEKKRERGKIARALIGAREKIAAVPAWFGKFNVVFKATESLDRFVEWAQRRGWTMDKRPPGRWLGEWLRQRQARDDARRLRATYQDVADWLSQREAMEFFDRWELAEG